MIKSKYIILVAALACCVTTVSCKKSTSAASVPANSAQTEHQEGKIEEPPHQESSEAKETSDLDRSVEDLVSRSCEHHKKTFECAECRYEVGFVRASSSLTDGGLMTRVGVAPQKIALPITLTGEIRFDERRVGHVSSQVEGIVKKVHVALGDKVKKGQALIEIESVALGEAQSSYLENQGLLRLAQRSHERVAELRKENISSEKEYLQAKQDLDAAEIRVEGALGKLTRLGADPAEARALSPANTRGRLVLRAPMDGSVLVMHAVSGEVAKSDVSLLTVGNSTTVWVWADLYERDIASVTRSQSAQKLAASVSVKAYPGEDFDGIVDLVSPAMDESSRTVKVRVEVKNADGRLLSGMFATVRLFLPGADEALAIPRVAVLEDEGRTFVFVHHQGDYYVRRPIVTGRSWAALVEVKSGLAPGQVVVAEGAFLMKSDVLRSKMGAGCAD